MDNVDGFNRVNTEKAMSSSPNPARDSISVLGAPIRSMK